MIPETKVSSRPHIQHISMANLANETWNWSVHPLPDKEINHGSVYWHRYLPKTFHLSSIVQLD